MEESDSDDDKTGKDGSDDDSEEEGWTYENSVGTDKAPKSLLSVEDVEVQLTEYSRVPNVSCPSLGFLAGVRLLLKNRDP